MRILSLAKKKLVDLFHTEMIDLFCVNPVSQIWDSPKDKHSVKFHIKKLCNNRYYHIRKRATEGLRTLFQSKKYSNRTGLAIL